VGRGPDRRDAENVYNNIKDAKGNRFKDWVHAETGFDVLKAQHPEFEMWSQGIHARSGVACADCHMAYKREGATKLAEHWVKSPLLSANRSCATCHPMDEEIKARVEGIQDRHFALMTKAGNAAVAMIDTSVGSGSPTTTRTARRPPPRPRRSWRRTTPSSSSTRRGRTRRWPPR
jgi:nitrite reductase (cytochrome c-552)